MKKTKEESTSLGTRKKKPSAKGGRLTDMFESMEKRASPLSAHKVATKYFDDFRKERQIAPEAEENEDTTAVDTVESSTILTAVDSAVVAGKNKKEAPKVKTGKKTEARPDPLLSSSENKVYGAMYGECVKRKTDTHRFGLKELKDITGLSDKTIRVSIHSLEKKKNISVVEPSLGIYGRKFKIFSSEEVEEERKSEGVVIDPTTKKVQE